MFRISVIILAIAVTIIAGDGTQTETHLNSQTEKQDTILEEESRKKDGKQVMKEEKQEINMHIENDEKICQHKRNVSECEEDYHDNEQLNKGIQLQEGKNMKTQHINKEQHLNVSIKPKYGEAEVSELHHGAKEGVKEGNDGELKERKRINEDSGPTQQVKKPFPLEEDTDEQAAQNNELENLQQGQHVDRLSEGYQVKETVHEEEHGVESRSGFNYLFSYHEDHTGHNLQPASKSFEDTSFGKRYVIQTSTLTDKDPAPHKFPVYIPEEKHVPYPVQKTAPYPIKQHVSHPVPVPVSATLHKQVPYTVYTPDPYPVKVPAARPYFVPVPAQKKVPFSVHVRVPVPQPYTVHVPKRYTVHVPKRYAVLLEKQVPATYPVRVEVPVSQPYPVNAKVPVPGKVPVDRPVLVPAEKTYPVTVQTDVHYPLQKPPYPVKVHVDRLYPVSVEKPYPFKVEKEIFYPVEQKFSHPGDKKVFYPEEVAVEKPIPVAVEKPHPVYVEREVSYPADKNVPVAKPVLYPVEKSVIYPIEITVPVTEKAEGSKEEGGALEDSFGEGHQG